MIRMPSRRVLVALSSLALLLALTACSDPQSTVDPKSDAADRINDVYILVFWLAMVVMVGVLVGTLVLSLWFRERPGRTARQIHGSTRLEVMWTLIPVVILAVIAVPTLETLIDADEDPPEDALRIEAIGHQWWFEFRYPDLGITTANEMWLPVDRAVDVVLISDDVIHSFWAPQLFGKVDMVPGHENRLPVFTPTEAREEAYLGQCVEFCGTSHANMRFRVFVRSAGEFDAWADRQVSDRAEPSTDLVQQGEQVFTTSACIGCHTIQGTSAAGIVGPNLTHVGGRSTIAAGILDNTPENLRRWIANPDDVKPGALMPRFDNQLTDEQLDALVAYLLSLD